MTSYSYSYSPSDADAVPKDGTLIATADATEGKLSAPEQRRKSRSKRKADQGRGRSPARPAERGLKGRSEKNRRRKAPTPDRKKSPHKADRRRRRRRSCQRRRSPEKAKSALHRLSPEPVGGGANAAKGSTVHVSQRPNEPAEPPKADTREPSSESTIAKAARRSEADNVKCQYCWGYYPAECLDGHHKFSKFCIGWQIYEKQAEGEKSLKQAKELAHEIWRKRKEAMTAENPQRQGHAEKYVQQTKTGNPPTIEESKKDRRRPRDPEKDKGECPERSRREHKHGKKR